jgi:hypothetical protein
VPNNTPGAEICNGLDDDCDGPTDEMDPNASCPGQLPGATGVASWTCTAGSCQVGMCAAGFTNPDTSHSNGCECTTDLNPASCGTAGDIAVPTDGWVDVSGVAESATSSDWFSFAFPDPGLGGQYYPRIEFLSDGGGAYAMDVYAGGCTAGAAGCADGEDGVAVTMWESSYYYTPGAGCCSDSTPRSAIYKVRVYRRFMDAPTCTAFSIRASELP